MKKRLLTMLLALVAIMTPIGAWAAIWERSVEIVIPECGFSTFYYSDFSCKIPEGISASIITKLTLDEDGMVTEIVEQAVENYIPAGCAVILRGEQGTYDFYESRESEQPYSENLLKGTDVQTSFADFAEEGFIYFTLDSYIDENTASLKAYWKYASSNFTNEAHKAYLALYVEEDYLELAEMLGALDNPHLQHTHGGCEICGQVTGVEAAWGTSADDLTSYGTLTEAVAAAGEEGSNIGYIKLLADVEEGIYVEGGNFTLDLNGHTISSEGHTLVIRNQSNVTIVDGSETNSGKVISLGEGSFAVGITNSASVTINGGTYKSTHLYALNLEGNSSATINGGSYVNSYLPVFIGEGCSATIVGGTFIYTENSAIRNNGNLLVKGGTFTYDGEDESYSTINYFNGSIDLSDYPVDDISDIHVANQSEIELDAETILLPEGCCFLDSDGTPVTILENNSNYYIGKVPAKYTITFAANGGGGEMESEIIYEGDYTLPECTFNAPEGMMFDGWQVGDDEESLYQPGEEIPVTADTEIKAVWTEFVPTPIAEAKWGTSADAETFTYGTLEEAFAAAYPYDEENETYISSEIRYIQLLSDVVNDNGYSIPGGEYTLDLNGKTLKSNGFTLDIRGGKVTIADESSDKSGKVITTGFDVTAVYNNEGSPKITIEGGQYKSNNQSAVSIESVSCEVTINGGEFTTTESADELITNLGTLTINGGTFDAQNAQYAIYVGGNTTISDGTFVRAQTADVTYCGGTLTFEATEATDKTPGFSPMGLRVEYSAEASINLPDGYGIYNENEEPQSELVTNMVYYIGKTGGVGYTVTFSANYDTEATMDDAIVTSPTGKYVLPECEFTAPDGMMFDGWQVGDDENNLYQPGERITVTANTVVKAVWGDIKIVINMYDSCGDGWQGAKIEVLENGVSIGTATLVDGDDARATFDYDSNCTYSFIWHYGSDEFYPHEISFEISIGEEQLFTSEESDCEGYFDGQQIYPLPTLDELIIADGTMEEFNMGKTKVGTLTYTRTLPNLTWNALYVPFEIPVTEEFLSKYDVAYINDVHSYDTDDNGTIDNMEMELIKIKSGTLRANYPYLIKAKSEEDKE
ncbi:MAG: InlB B-repeat-containing protein, partial [Bacteroidaceae bacterium]|nr:InlB B-repeat-containing protein [Bacteroidaceae bacterium]